jgi:hypothetical protein
VGDTNGDGSFDSGDVPPAANSGEAWIAGKLAIGTRNPIYLVDIQGNSLGGIRYTRANARDARITVADPTQAWSMASGWSAPGDFSIVQEGAAGDRFYISLGGYAGIGTTDPRARLEVDGGIRVNKGDAGADGTNAGYGFEGDGDTGIFAVPTSGGAETQWMDSDILVKTDNEFRMRIYNNCPGNVCLDIEGQGRQAANTEYWVKNSDARLKKNIQTIADPLARILRLRGVTFEWQDEKRARLSSGTQLGFISQEVERVFPQWVSDDADGYKLLATTGFDALAVEALRELDRKISILEKENEQLKTRIRSLERK